MILPDKTKTKIQNTMSNGKGSKPRNNHSEAFRANFEAINWRRQDEQGESTTSEASKRAKSQGNSLSEAITASQKEGK